MNGRTTTLDLRPGGRSDSPTVSLRRDRRPTLGLPHAARPADADDADLSNNPPTILGEWLVYRGILTREQLLRALATSHLHEWRIGDAVVVLKFAPRVVVEAEVKLLARRKGHREPRRPDLERRALRLEREVTDRIRRSDVETPPE